ncbi:---NA--- : : Trans_reg_C [Gemmataceae bacterium]|nr:---NA--- : : Trans_reg_C [Gemmataceae bacterium]VTT98890.1 ---NA--- : : Trans_reg_C [Gemmataceae bacterium]
MAAATAKADLEFLPPETVAFGKRRVRVGGTSYRLLQAMFAAPKGEVAVADLCPLVWGRAGVERNTVKGAVHRARQVLMGLRHPRRVMLDDEVVRLD